MGWGFKLVSMTATVAQLGQTVGEVAGSPQSGGIRRHGDDGCADYVATDGEFPQTAETYTITAQYTGNTTRTYAGRMPGQKAPSIVAEWKDVPVGGKVSFVVAMFDKNGWGVGKGQAGPFDNVINGNGIFAAKVIVEQALYPLATNTTYEHRQLLQYDAGGYYGSRQTGAARPGRT